MLPAAAMTRALNADPDRALLDASRRGDGAALEQLCVRLRPRLYRAAYAVLRDADEADDVAQEALVKLVTKRFWFLGTGSVAGWTVRIAVNAAKNRRRDGRRRQELLAGADLVPAGPPDARALLVDKERADRLDAALGSLPSRQQDVARLRLIGRLDFDEIAAALAITEPNARMAMSLAGKKLRALLDGGAR
jgi:RNA polymerase sigma factor (sigma-70 family)